MGIDWVFIIVVTAGKDSLPKHFQSFDQAATAEARAKVLADIFVSAGFDPARIELSIEQADDRPTTYEQTITFRFEER